MVGDQTILEMESALMCLTIQIVIMMVGIVVELIWTPIGALNVYVMKIWTVQLHLIWLPMAFVMMNPTMQVAILMVGIAVDFVSTQNIVRIVCAMKDQQWI